MCSFQRLRRRIKTKNFLSIFCRLPHTPAENLRKEGKFLVLYRDRRERTRRGIGAYDSVQRFHALRACEIGSRKVYNYSTKTDFVIF